MTTKNTNLNLKKPTLTKNNLDKNIRKEFIVKDKKENLPKGKMELVKGALQKMVSGGHCEGGHTHCAPPDGRCTSCWQCNGNCRGQCLGGQCAGACNNGCWLRFCSN